MRRKLALVAALSLTFGLTGCTKIESRDLLREGNQLYELGQFEAAIEKYSESLKLEPDGVTVLWNRAMAAESVVLALKDSTEDADILKRREYATMALEDLELWNERREKVGSQDNRPECERAKPEPEAKADSKALGQEDADDDRDPDLIAYNEHRLAILGADVRCDDLIEHWRQFHQACPQNEDLYMTIAQTFEDICGKPEKADEWYVKRTQDFPDSAKAWYSLATRRFDPLFPDPEAGLPFNPQIDSARRIEIADEVIGYLENASKIDPKYRDPFVWRSMAYTQKSLAREFLDPPENTEDKIQAILSRRDLMLAWRETKAVCDIDEIPDCPADPDVSQLIANPGGWKDREINIAGNVVNESVTQNGSYVWEFDLEVEYTPVPAAPGEEPSAPAAPPAEAAEGGEAAPAGPQKKLIRVKHTFLAPEAEEGGEVPDISEQMNAQIDQWKKLKSVTFSGVISASSENPAEATLTLVSVEKPLMGCCPAAPLTPEEEKAEAEQLQQLEAQLAAEQAAAEEAKKGKGKGKGK